MDSGSKGATINVPAFLDGSYLLWFDLKYDKILTTVSGIVSIGSRNCINVDDVVCSDVVSGHMDGWTGMNIDRVNRCVKTEREHVIFICRWSWSKGCYRRNRIRFG